MKRGETRPDGMIFWRTYKGKDIPDMWVTPEKFEEMKEKDRLSTRKYAKSNPDKVRAYIENNREKIRDRERKRNRIPENAEKKNRVQREVRNSCPIRQEAHRMRNRINRFRLINGWSKKAKRTESMLGCEWAEFKAHIEERFKPGMSWDNFGEWEMDHVIPIASAKSIEDLRHLCHFSNIQPLWRLENRQKQNKILPP